MKLSPDACVDARRHFSLLLDGELSEIERLRLEAHLDSCPACRAFNSHVSTATQMLRTSEAEEPGFEIVLPRRRRVPIRMLQAGTAAAAVALVAGLSTVHGLGHRQSIREPVRLSPSASFGVSHDDEIAPLRRTRVRRVQRVAL